MGKRTGLEVGVNADEENIPSVVGDGALLSPLIGVDQTEWTFTSPTIGLGDSLARHIAASKSTTDAGVLAAELTTLQSSHNRCWRDDVEDDDADDDDLLSLVRLPVAAAA